MTFESASRNCAAPAVGCNRQTQNAVQLHAPENQPRWRRSRRLCKSVAASPETRMRFRALFIHRGNAATHRNCATARRHAQWSAKCSVPVIKRAVSCVFELLERTRSRVSAMLTIGGQGGFYCLRSSAGISEHQRRSDVKRIVPDLTPVGLSRMSAG
jgi:hypothetical protein